MTDKKPTADQALVVLAVMAKGRYSMSLYEIVRAELDRLREEVRELTVELAHRDVRP